MACTVLKSTNVVDQSINVFPPADAISKVRVVRNPDSDTPDTYIFRNDVFKNMKVLGGTLSSATLGFSNVTEVGLGSSRDITVKLDEGRNYCYLVWDTTDRIMGLNIGSGAYPDYRLGLHSDKTTNINGVVLDSPKFNQPINQWVVSEVEEAPFVFAGCSSFNREINWYVPKLWQVTYILAGCSNLNKKVSLKGAKPIDISYLLSGCAKFNSDIEIDTSHCVNFEKALAFCVEYNKPINFNFSSATNISGMLAGTAKFNQPINFGNTPNLTEAWYLFEGSAFNQPITMNAPKLNNVSGWFSNNVVFNNSINVDFSNVINMSYMFWNASSFNQPIGHWNIGNVLNFENFTYGATAFNQDLSAWCAKFNVNANIAHVSVAPNWSTENYDKYLNALWLDVGTTRKQAWINGTSNKIIYAQAKYSSASKGARDGLLGLGWTIQDGGQTQ